MFNTVVSVGSVIGIILDDHSILEWHEFDVINIAFAVW